MSSTGVDVESARLSGALDETQGSAKEKVSSGNGSPESVSVRSIRGDHTHRKLKSRHIQLIGPSRAAPPALGP